MFQIQTFSLASLENNCNRGKWIRRTAGRDCKVGHKNEKRLLPLLSLNKDFADRLHGKQMFNFF